MDSQHASINLQKNIKDNTEALHDFLADLKNWEKEMKALDRQLSSQASSNDNSGEDTNTPPIRSRSILKPTSPSKDPAKGDKSKEAKQAENKQMASNSKKAKRMPRDFAAWDKFDVDKALESSEEEKEEEEEEEEKHKQATSQTNGRNPRASKKERANALKEEGNKLYGRGRLEDAVAKYTQGMALDPTNALLPANRAMAYIKLKKYTAAEADCNRCLKLDCNYLKAFLRRATARLNQGKEELARRDYLKVLEMEPYNREARRGLDELNGTKQTHTATETHTQSNTAAETHREEGTNESKGKEEKMRGAKKEDEEGSEGVTGRSRDEGREATEGATSKENEGGRESEETERKDTERKKGTGKKVTIIEVNSSNDRNSGSRLVKGAIQLFPVDKPPHHRSKKSLQRIPVKDVTIWEEMEAEESRRKGGGKEEIREEEKREKAKKEKPVRQEPPVVVSPKATMPSVPRTSHQFSQDWHQLSSAPEAALKYLKMIPSKFFHSVDLETSTLVEVAEALGGAGVPAEEAAQYFGALSHSPGFSISLMFLEGEQRQVILNLITKCKQVESHTAKMEELEATLSSL